MDAENPVVALCARGMRAEADGRADEARRLFEQAWGSAVDDYDACVAAHYLARQQPSPEKTLRWNRACLERADLVGDARVAGFYPSLHLNMAKSYGDLGDRDRAREHWEQAAAHIDAVPAGPYGDWVRFAIREGLREGAADTGGVLADLVARWCARAELKALGLVLPAYVGDLGSAADRERLVSALRMVHAGRWLPEEEQGLLGRELAERE
ncbi:hypothetical protein OG897_00910 [Streptomyces sp. NBC_00237]|uniref:hypothetical protein n=1 Tax=Streptomyces sp. NBC_00237 TaxID=2975687 RepID=UPI00225A19D7|nr:hypothetical protein [Streptomyces sp. NBC_00237]MCX5200026.1 hypothetical protein [Streptomyces sp. NBC_00237]